MFNTLWPYIALMLLAFAQNISFTLVSRARNRNNRIYHVLAAIGSNGVWFLTFAMLVKANMELTMFIPYCIGSVSGSLFGAEVAIRIEKAIGATT